MSDFDFAKAYAYFDEPMARNILFIGDNFDFEKDKAVLNLKWNTVFTFLQKREDVDKLQFAMDTETRCINVLKNNLEDAQKIPQQFDPRNLNVIALWYLAENEETGKSLNTNRRIAKDTIDKFCAQAIARFGCAYFVGFTEDSWFKAENLLDAMHAVFEREDCILIDRCSDADFADLREMIADENGRCTCFKFLNESLAEQWAPLNTSTHTSDAWEDDFFDEPVDSDQCLFFVGKKSASIEKKDLRDISSFARLLDYDEMNPPPKPKYLHPSYFASFLKNNTNYPKWFGYAEKYALERSFQKELTDVVRASLENPANFEHRPILLHGQSGAGKSVAVGQLAYEIFHEKKFPVIYITNPNVTFSFSRDNTDASVRYNALFNLIKMLQDKYDAKSVLLIWDCSGFEFERTNYHRLYTHLRNSGLNVTLVGTNYQLNKNASLKQEFYDICADIRLDPDERTQFRSILKNKTNLDITDIDAILRYSKEDNFLAILYHIFYDIRSDISRGIYAEFRETVKDVLQEACTVQEGMFGQFVMRANQEKFNSFLASLNTEDNQKSKLKEFAIYSAILTYFNMSMSLDMIFGLFSANQDSLIKALNAPIFIATEQAGVWHYKVRSRLEAEMLLRAHQMSPHGHNKDLYTVYLCRLLYMIETGQFASEAADEAIEKVTRIISAVGPNNRENESLRWAANDFYKYAPCLINALSAAGEQTRDPRILVQELTLTRELTSKPEALAECCDYETFVSIMREARDWEEGIDDDFFRAYHAQSYIPDLADKSTKGEKFLQAEEGMDMSLRSYFDQLRVEMANGRLAMAMRNKEHPNADQLVAAGRLCDKVLRVSGASQKHAISTLVWTRAHLLKTTLEETEKQEYISDTLEKIFTALQQTKDIANHSQFVQACNELFNMIDSVLDVDALAEKMRVEKPTAAMLYCCAFQACRRAGFIRTEPCIEWKSVDDTEAVRAIYDRFFSEEYLKNYTPDARCLNLQMRLFWLMHNKTPLLVSGERQRTYFTDEQWCKLLSICEQAKNLPATENTFYLRYVLALAYAQLGDIAACNSEFSALRGESEDVNQTMRNIPRYLLCHADGTPKLFSGKIHKFEDSNATKGRMDIYGPDRRHIASNVFFNRNNIFGSERVDLEQYKKTDKIIEDLCIGVSFVGISATREKVARE